ncbi:hypothetical protein ACFRK5_14050 [Streptomyces niveus]|uniref:hypothetical protein n=1 Tax=Streptomyces niveus TaxID=193462 RepID=UPI0036BFE743
MILVKQVWAATALLTALPYGAVTTSARPAAVTATGAPALTAKAQKTAHVSVGGIAAGLPSPAWRDAGRAG